MAIARLASQDATGTGSNVTTVSAVYAATPTANNLLIAVYGDSDGNNGGPVTITGWTSAISTQGSSGTDAWIFFKVATGAESTTVTATNANTPFTSNIAIFEYSGLATSSVLDKTAVGSSGIGATSTPTGTTATTTLANELLIAGVVVSGVAATGPSWSNSFTVRATTTNATGPLFTSDRIVSATGAYTTTVTYTGSGTGGAGVIATFKAAAISTKVSSLSILGAG